MDLSCLMCSSSWKPCRRHPKYNAFNKHWENAPQARKKNVFLVIKSKNTSVERLPLSNGGIPILERGIPILERGIPILGRGIPFL